LLQVVERLGLSYHNTRALHQKIDSIPDKTGEWTTQELSFKDRPDDKFTIWYRDPIKAIQSLWNDPELSPKMVFAPQKIYSDGTRKNRIFSEVDSI